MTARPVPSEAELLARLVGGDVAARIADGDPALWPRVARPGWTGAVRAARPLVGEIAALAEQRRVAGQVRVVLAAAGGTGVAAEALTGSDPRLVVLDTTDPPQVADALAGELAATVLVVSVPPGEDPEPVRLLRDMAHAAFRAEGLDPQAHTVVVTPPDGPLLPEHASPAGTVVVLAPDDVDGPWAAFTGYALVPAGLAGVDVGAVLAEAGAIRAELGTAGGDALGLGALLASAPAFALAAPDAPALAEWAAQLVAGGLGKDGHGPLPVVVEGPNAPEWGTLPAVGLGDVPGATFATRGSVAEQMATWQHAVAAAAHVLSVDPTDRADALAAPAAVTNHGPAFTEAGVAVHAGDWLPASTATVADALRVFVGAALVDPDDGSGARHLAVHAYLDRIEDASAAVLRAELARRTGLPTTFGWAPRCLPGSGQHAKGGPGDVLVCQLTADPDDPGLRPEAAAALDAVQQGLAAADAAALAARGRRVLRLHFTDRVAGLVTLARAVQQL
ncbi:glucose-6-phosphate isomerase [Pseudonocardia sp. DSM 110487]|uniref:glucose-6-phosphate isomerase n=1 Tax=Pseudonocardia sp. DSM 110487 TaxID=2865833 RepID=UPI001C69477F|nr:glucose-6-phosphate isomerase [Pseudonocardia sp. DSM 110487]QYN39798.1 glucose-6-phosphate isomerase [Pseudonocardia sp. DSM 110487]